MFTQSPDDALACAVRWLGCEPRGVAAMPLAEALVALAALAGNTVVTAAVTDAWESARKGFARLLGRGDPAKTKLADERLAETRDRLTQAAGEHVEQTRAALEGQWVTRVR